MCTVSLIPKGNSDFILTSNRDEAPNRETVPPEFYSVNKSKLLFPKDALAGGTWIGVSNHKRVICLLNGGFSKHKRQDSYRLSRGIVVKDLLLAKNAQTIISDYNLINIEPFTMIIVEWQTGLRFFELVWDGEQKHFKNLPLEPQIWSSTTLYSSAMKAERKHWFEQFKSNNYLSKEALLKFHKHTHIENKDYGVIIDRGFVKTTSVSQVVKSNNIINMSFNNLNTNRVTHNEFHFTDSVYG